MLAAPASSPQPVHLRARAPSARELEGIPWLACLEPAQRDVAVADLRVVAVESGETLCRVGRPVTYWFGVVDGLLKMSNESARRRSGRHDTETDTVPVTFAGLPPGGWFGEGTVIKREAYRYNVQALRNSVVAGIGVETFHWLFDRSIPFNRFIVHQLNERLGQFIGARETDRMNNVEARVARSLAALFHPVLFPGVKGVLRITQQELGYLVGLSRSRTNMALQALQQSGLIRVEYGGVSVIDVDALRRVV